MAVDNLQTLTRLKPYALLGLKQYYPMLINIRIWGEGSNSPVTVLRRLTVPLVVRSTYYRPPWFEH